MKKIFSSLLLPEPSEDLFFRVCEVIRKEKLAISRRNACIMTALFMCSGISFIFASHGMITNFSNSEFMDFLSIIVSDVTVALIARESLLFALLESFPFVSVMVTLIAITICLQSLRSLAIHMNDLFYQSMPANTHENR